MSPFTVLGASGVIGRRLTATLKNSGHEVNTPPRGCSEIFTSPLGHVIYCIGLTADFRTRPFDTVEAHVCLLSKILQHADFNSFLYLSSTRVYSGADSTLEEGILRVCPANPSDLYNLSKLTGESLCCSCGREGVRIARVSNVVHGDDENSSNFIPSLYRDARLGQIEFQTALTSEKDYIHIDDVVATLINIAERGTDHIYNVASGIQLSNQQWAEHLKTVTGCKILVRDPAPEIKFLPIDNTRICNSFAFTPRSVLT